MRKHGLASWPASGRLEGGPGVRGSRRGRVHGDHPCCPAWEQRFLGLGQVLVRLPHEGRDFQEQHTGDQSQSHRTASTIRIDAR